MYSATNPTLELLKKKNKEQNHDKVNVKNLHTNDADFVLKKKSHQ